MLSITIQPPGMTHPLRIRSRILAWMVDRKQEDPRAKRGYLTKLFCSQENYPWLSEANVVSANLSKVQLTQ